MMKSALFIDDDEDFIYCIRRLHGSGKIPNLKEMYEAFNGKEALAFLEKALESNGPFPDALFVDLNMPILDGIGFLKQFKQRSMEISALQSIHPIAVVTSSTNPKDKAAVEELKIVEEYLLKDLTLSDLANCINELLQ